MRLPNPVEDEEVLLALRRALRSKPRRPKQAYGLTKDSARQAEVIALPVTVSCSFCLDEALPDHHLKGRPPAAAQSA